MGGPGSNSCCLWPPGRLAVISTNTFIVVNSINMPTSYRCHVGLVQGMCSPTLATINRVESTGLAGPSLYS